MKRTNLESLVTEKALHLVNGSGSDFILERMTEDPNHVLPIKNVCAKVSTTLSDEMDSIVALLGISKRVFLEAAFVDAVAKANEIIEVEGVWGALQERSEVFAVREDEARVKDSAKQLEAK